MGEKNDADNKNALFQESSVIDVEFEVGDQKKSKISNSSEQEDSNKNVFNFSNKVVQSNALARASSEMGLVPLKLFKAAVSCINTGDGAEAISDTVYIHKSDILLLSGSGNQPSHNYTYLRDQLMSLKQQSICLHDEKTGRYSILSPIRQIFWDDSSMVGIQFEELLMPQLVGLSKRFTQYHISNLVGVKSKYTINLYESLLSRTREFGEKQITILIEDLRGEMGTTVTRQGSRKKKVLYERIGEFDRRVIRPAVEEINKLPNFEFFITDVKKNKSKYKANQWESYTFTLRRRTSCTDTLDEIRFPERLKYPI